MRTYIVMLLLSAGFCLACQGCTHRAWYKALQEKQRQDGDNDPHQNEIQKCLARANSMSYDEYKNLREDAARQPR